MSALEELAERSGERFPHLLEARARTERQLPGMRDRLRETEIDTDVSVVLFGSWGRQEGVPTAYNGRQWWPATVRAIVNAAEVAT